MVGVFFSLWRVVLRVCLCFRVISVSLDCIVPRLASLVVSLLSPCPFVLTISVYRVLSYSPLFQPRRARHYISLYVQSRHLSRIPPNVSLRPSPLRDSSSQPRYALLRLSPSDIHSATLIHLLSASRDTTSSSPTSGLVLRLSVIPARVGRYAVTHIAICDNLHCVIHAFQRQSPV